MSSVNDNLSPNQAEKGSLLAEAYSYAAPALHPLNHELGAAQPPLKLHIDARSAMEQSLSQNLAIVAPCPIFSLLRAKPFAPAAPVGLTCLGSSPGCFFGVRAGHPRLDLFIQNRIKWLTTTYDSKAKQQLSSPRDAIQDLWQKACDNDPGADLTGMAPRLILGSADSDKRDMATMFYQLIFGQKAASQQQIIEAAKVQPVVGPGEVAIEFFWLESAAGAAATDSYAIVYELGKIWDAITGLPFVLSLWQCHDQKSPAVANRLLQAAQLAEAKMKIDPRAYLTGVAPAASRQLSSLWQRTRYLMGEDDFLGLQLIGQLLQLSRQRSDHDFYLRSSRWNTELASQPNTIRS